MAQTAKERWEQYLICQRRGHRPSGVTFACVPPLSVCEFCGTHYRYAQQLVEAGQVPTDPTKDVK